MASLTPEIRAELLAIYAEADRLVATAAPVCELSGKCCRFKEYGHQLYLTRPEAELLMEPGLPVNTTVSPAGCPFQINSLCTARERRPLGCRIFFCDSNYREVGPLIMEQSLDQIKALHRKWDLEWDYGDLFSFLESLAGSADGDSAPS